MALIQRGLMLVATAGALAIPAHFPAPVDAGGGISAKRIAAPTTANYQPNQLEYYLGDSGLAYIRPGVNVKIVAVTNSAPGQKPIVELLLTDDLGQPLDANGGVAPGVVTFGFIMDAWDPTIRYYIAYTGTPAAGPVTSASRDQGGTITVIDVGHYKYNFGQAIPATHDVKKAITIGVYATRALSSIIGKDYYAPNVFYDFKADGSAVKTGDVWANMDVTKSCNKCHDPLGGLYGAVEQIHGGTRSNVKICVLCHNQNHGTNGQADAKLFYHRIHMGKYLPSVVAGIYVAYDVDASTIAWPGGNNSAPRDCMTCHEQSAPEKDVWKTRPTRVACGSCHDNVNFSTGQGHGPAGTSTVAPQADDSQCATCHPADPVAGVEFDASVSGAHVVPYQSKQLKGLIATIDHVSNLTPGKSPTVTFKITSGDKTAVDGTTLARIGPIIGGPTFSYSNPGITGTVSGQPLRETTAANVKFDSTTGLTSYTFTGTIPATWTGSVAVTADIYRTVNLTRGDGQAAIAQREAAFNDVQYFSLDSSLVVPRRVAVDINLCNSCHGALGTHGGSRQTTLECVICHNPAAVTGTGTAAQGISFQRFIHRIHTGNQLSQPFDVGAFSANTIHFPGDRRDCLKCHVAGAYILPLTDYAIGSAQTPNDYLTVQGPATAACLGCHDLRDNAAHAYINTAPFGEACDSCHSGGMTYGVDRVHAR